MNCSKYARQSDWCRENPERRKQLPPTDHYKQRFLDANCADLSFYPVWTSRQWRGASEI